MKQAMKDMGYNQKQLAIKLNTAQTTVSKVALGKDNVSDDLKEMAYDFLNNPFNKNIEVTDKKKEIKENTIKEETPISELIEDAKPIDLKEFNLDADSLLKENQKLKRQIFLYEKLIERL